jgi:hypothetical protein
VSAEHEHRRNPQSTRWFPTAKALRALGIAVPCVVADDEPLICVHELVEP